MNTQSAPTIRLTISCPDRPGIVAAVSGFLQQRSMNIVHSDQHSTDPQGGRFFMRNEFCVPTQDQELFEKIQQEFDETVAKPFGMKWRMHPAWKRRKTAILVSKFDHALMELLWRFRRGELDTEISMVISNHPDLGRAVESFDVPFHHVPVGKRLRAKVAAEDQILELMNGEVDLVVLARYMQILTSEFVSHLPNSIINIHHSFLPAFVGADPYRRAFERGVKLIGATAHYVTEELDQGPIIEQDVIRVNHGHTVEDLKRHGADIERHVLARAVRWHLEDRVIVHGNKTIVFKR